MVDSKPSGRSRLSKGQEDKFRRQWEQEQYWQWKKYKFFVLLIQYRYLVLLVCLS